MKPYDQNVRRKHRGICKAIIGVVFAVGRQFSSRRKVPDLVNNDIYIITDDGDYEILKW